ncbi:MAG: glycosyl transferase family 1, partial [Candidatus Entotheonellia bacterium]
MKILHISTMDDGGAGKAAARLHCGLLRIGVDSQMLVKQSASGAPGIFPLVPQKPTLRVRLHDEIRRRRLHRDLARYTEGRPVRRGALSDDRTLLDLSRHPLIRNADVIHLHWIAQFVDFTALFSSVTVKPIVWTLHDMHPFTGGCHYAGDCLKYERSCGDCPQLAS